MFTSGILSFSLHSRLTTFFSNFHNLAICRECRTKVKRISLETTSSNHEKEGTIETGAKDENRDNENRGLMGRQLKHRIYKEDDRGSIDECVVRGRVDNAVDEVRIRNGDVMDGRGVDDDATVDNAGGDCGGDFSEGVGNDDDDASVGNAGGDISEGVIDDNDDENAGGDGVGNDDDGASASYADVDVSEGVGNDNGVGGELVGCRDFGDGVNGGDGSKAEVVRGSDVNNCDVHSGGDDVKSCLSVRQSHSSNGDGDEQVVKFDSGHEYVMSADYSEKTSLVSKRFFCSYSSYDNYFEMTRNSRSKSFA